MIDDKVSECINAWIGSNASDSGRNTNQYHFPLFSLLSASSSSNEQTWQDISFCNLRGGGGTHPARRAWSQLKAAVCEFEHTHVGSGSVWLISRDCRIFAVHFNWKLVQVPPSLFMIFGANTDDLHRWTRINLSQGKKRGRIMFSPALAPLWSCSCVKF